MKSSAPHNLALQIAVFFFGITGLLPKFMSGPVPATVIVWGRASFAILALGCWSLARRQRPAVPTRGDMLLVAAQGLMLTLNLTTFFLAIQVSSVTVALLGFSPFPVFALVLERIFLKTPFRRSDWVAMGMILAGLVLVLLKQEGGRMVFDLGGRVPAGLGLGVLSGFACAAVNVLGKKSSSRHDPAHLALGQNLIVAVLLTPVALLHAAPLTGRDWLVLAVLGIFCTALTQSLLLYAMQKVRAFTASLMVAALEPVYGILGAWLFFHEAAPWTTLAGGAVILAAALYAGLQKPQVAKSA